MKPFAPRTKDLSDEEQRKDYVAEILLSLQGQLVSDGKHNKISKSLFVHVVCELEATNLGKADLTKDVPEGSGDKRPGDSAPASPDEPFPEPPGDTSTPRKEELNQPPGDIGKVNVGKDTKEGDSGGDGGGDDGGNGKSFLSDQRGKDSADKSREVSSRKGKSNDDEDDE